MAENRTSGKSSRSGKLARSASSSRHARNIAEKTFFGKPSTQSWKDSASLELDRLPMDLLVGHRKNVIFMIFMPTNSSKFMSQTTEAHHLQYIPRPSVWVSNFNPPKKLKNCFGWLFWGPNFRRDPEDSGIYKNISQLLVLHSRLHNKKKHPSTTAAPTNITNITNITHQLQTHPKKKWGVSVGVLLTEHAETQLANFQCSHDGFPRL